MPIELIGGPADGRMFVVSWDFLNRPLHVSIMPSISEMITGYGKPGQQPLLRETETLPYEWDGTVREDGVRRFRLR